MKKFFALTNVVLIASLLLVACAPAATPMPQAEPVQETMPEPAPTQEPVVEEAPKTIVDIAVADGRFTTLVAALQAADLADTLAGEGPFTVFAPTDDAFAKLPTGTVEALLADIPALSNILLYHVVSGDEKAASVVAMEKLTTLQGKDVMVKLDGDKVFLNDAQVTITDIQASNGTIHVIDTILLPPTNTIVDAAVNDGRFTTLVAALGAANLVDTLKGEGPFTVFAPTDDAFAKLPAGTVEALLADIPALTDILLYHVASGKLMASDVVASDYLTTLQGESARISSDMGKAMINDVEIIITDIETDNGIIHVIDSVILPGKTIADVAVADDRFTTLVAALGAANLVETLSGEGPFTIFAPTDDAFAKLPAGTLEALLADIPSLTNILLYHVVSGKVMAADVVTLTKAPTVLGQNVMVKVDGDKVFINDSQVIITDIVTKNGVIHVIDTVLIPE